MPGALVSLSVPPPSPGYLEVLPSTFSPKAGWDANPSLCRNFGCHLGSSPSGLWSTAIVQVAGRTPGSESDRGGFESSSSMPLLCDLGKVPSYS